MICKNCSNDQSFSALEMRLELCLSCIQDRVRDYDELKKVRDNLSVENAKLTEELNSEKLKVDKFKNLMVAEISGRQACQSGLPDDQSPYESGSDDSAMWLAGWTAVDTRRKALQAHAVMTWSEEVLDAVIQIARGNDETEIVGKLETILSKFQGYIK